MRGIRQVLLEEIRTLHHRKHIPLRTISAMMGVSLGRIKEICKTPPRKDPPKSLKSFRRDSLGWSSLPRRLQTWLGRILVIGVTLAGPTTRSEWLRANKTLLPGWGCQYQPFGTPPSVTNGVMTRSALGL
jgi:hypothetical protein